MRLRPLSPALLLAAACSAPAGPPVVAAGSGPADATAAATPTWKTAMTTVGEEYDALEKLLKRPTGDLHRVTAAATHAADLLRLGYGRCEDKRVPGFAQHARAAESWLLQVALEARQGHADLAAAAFREGRDHCAHCHEAAKPFYTW